MVYTVTLWGPGRSKFYTKREQIREKEQDKNIIGFSKKGKKDRTKVPNTTAKNL